MENLHSPLKKVYLKGNRATHGYNAVDLAWWDYDGTPDTGVHANVYACGDGTVLKIVDGCPDYRDDSYGYGNYIIIKYKAGYNGYSGCYLTIFAHLKKNSFTVKEGQSVKQGQLVALLDNSGHSLGTHLHLECFRDSFWSQHGIMPTECIYLTQDNVWESNPSVAGEFPWDSVVLPVDRDVCVDQLYVSTSNLRVRKAPSLTGGQVDTARIGYYNVTEMVDADGYTWCKVSDEYWMAIVNGCSELIAKSFAPVERNKKVDQVEVTITNLRIREQPNTDCEQLGVCPAGVYDVQAVFNATDYTWYKVCGCYIAGVDGVTFLEVDDERDQIIADLKMRLAKINELTVVEK